MYLHTNDVLKDIYLLLKTWNSQNNNSPDATEATLQQVLSQLQSLQTNTNVTVSNEVEVKNDLNNPLNVSLPTSVNNTLNSIDTKLTNPLEIRELDFATDSIDVSNSVIKFNMDKNSSFYPDPSNYIVGQATKLKLDSSDNLQTRGPITTDEGSFRHDFDGGMFETMISGIADFSVTSVTVLGYGTSFLTEVKPKMYLKWVGGGADEYRQVVRIISDTELEVDYPFTTGTSDSIYITDFIPMMSGLTSLTLAASNAVINIDSTLGLTNYIARKLDYPSLVFNTKLSVTNRLNGQDIYIGLQKPEAIPTFNIVPQTYFARFKLTGTNNSIVICESAGCKNNNIATVNDIESTTVVLANNATTNLSLNYRIEMKMQRVFFYVNNTLVAEHETHIPSQYDILQLLIGSTNTTNVSSNQITIDYIQTNNLNELGIYVPSLNEGFTTFSGSKTIYGAVNAVNTDMFSLDCSKFSTLFFHMVGGGNGTITFQGSNDGINWLNVIGYNSLTPTSSTSTASATAAGYVIPVCFKYHRFRCTTYNSGPINAYITQTTNPQQLFLNTAITSAATTQSGTWRNEMIPNTGTLGLSGYRVLSTTTTNAASIKATAGRIFNITATNTGASTVFLKLHNSATAPSVGVTAVVRTYALIPNQILQINLTGGDYFSSGIGMSITANYSDTDATVLPTAGQAIVNIHYN